MQPPIRLIERTASAHAYPLMIKQLLQTPLSNAPAQEIVYRGDRRMCYTEFSARVARLANALAKLGVRPGDTVAVMDWDSHRYLEAYFAVPMMGAVLMMVNVRLSNDQVAYTLDHSGARLLLAHQDFLLVLQAIRPQVPKLDQVVLLSDEPAGSSPEGTAGEYEALLAQAGAERDFADFDENAMATTFYTTGTTGLPKAVYFSHRQIVLHTLAAAAALGGNAQGQRFHRGDVYMPLTPMFHVHAWGLPFVATLLGVKQVYPGRYVPEHIVELVRAEGVTFSHGVPTVLKMVLDAAGAQSFPGWKIVAGGSVLPVGLCRLALDKGIDIFTGYGMSESCPILSLAQLEPGMEGDDGVDMRVSAGRALPLVQLQVVDESLQAQPRDGKSVGEVVVRAPWLTQGYRGNPDASETLWHGGVMHTQDIGRIDGGGVVRLVDRAKDVIKTGGEWVSSLDLEQLIASHPGVAEVAVIAVPSEKWGERPVAVVVPRGDFAATLTEDDLRKVVAEKALQGAVSRYAVPDRFHFVATIDKTSVGKFDKKALRRKFATGAPH